jgi:hypothetical protein
MRATGAEHIAGIMRNSGGYDTFFDASFTRGQDGGAWPYNLYYLFQSYLLAHYSESGIGPDPKEQRKNNSRRRRSTRTHREIGKVWPAVLI